MSDFDPFKPFATRDGREVRDLHIQGSIGGVVDYEGVAWQVAWPASGRYLVDGTLDGLDLVNVDTECDALGPKGAEQTIDALADPRAPETARQGRAEGAPAPPGMRLDARSQERTLVAKASMAGSAQGAEPGPAIGAILAALHTDIDPALVRAMLVALRDHVVASRPPDVLIGGAENPYMRRWWLIPRDKHGFNVYLHHFLRSDDDRALHDHPWANLSVLIEGSYFEHTPEGAFTRREGDIVFRPNGEMAHRIELLKVGSAAIEHELFCDRPVWTLFVTGPKVREWGFHCPKGWVHWKAFTGQDDANGPVGVYVVGPGCGETDA